MLPFIVGGAILAVGFGVLAAFFDVETEKEKERQNTLKKDIKDYTRKAQQAKKRHKHQQTLKDRRPLSQYYPTLFARN